MLSRTLLAPIVAIAALTAAPLEGKAAVIDFGLLLPAITANLGDGSVVPLPTFGLDDFRIEEQGDGSVRIALINPITVEGVLSIDTIDAHIDFDPFIDAMVTVTNTTTGPVSFTFFFVTPFIGSYNQLDLAAQASVTDGGRDGASLDPFGFTNIVNAGISLTSQSLVSVGLGCQFGDENPGGTEQCFDETESTGGSFSPPDTLSMTMAFTVSGRDPSSDAGQSDSATLHGVATLGNVLEVPEPASLALVGLPLLLLGWRRRAR